MTISYAEATALKRLEPGRYAIDLDGQWSIGPKLHGGYLLAVLAEAAREESPTHPDVSAIAASFISAPDPGPAELLVTTLRTGRSTTNVRVELTQHGQVRSQAFVTQATLTSNDAWWSSVELVEVPPFAKCFRIPSDPPGFSLPLFGAVDLRVDPDSLQWAMGKPSMRGQTRGWIQLEDGTDWTPTGLLVAVDSATPQSFDLGAPGWAPTIQMTVYVRRLPAPGPVRFEMHANDVGDDRMDETCTVWDSAGRVVAQATQLAGVRIPS